MTFQILVNAFPIALNFDSCIHANAAKGGDR